jgi:hypothetical protein
MNSGDNIVDAVRKFLLRNKVKIIFGTPCFGGLLHNGFFQSMLELAGMFTRLAIPFEVITIGNESLIQRARNGIVAKFLADEQATHLMFIDADITFSWISIVKLLLSGKELSGGCYPKKCFNWDKIKHHIGKNPSMKDDELMAKSLDYVFNPIYHKQPRPDGKGEQVIIRLENGMAQVKDIGTGFMMIHKSVFTKMIAKYPETKYKNNVAGYGQSAMNDYFYTLFDCCIDPVSRVYLSEDYLFCKRWIDIGGELWLDLNTNLNHTGLIDYKGCLALTIGEVDTLNKDAQILRAQAAAATAASAPVVNKDSGLGSSASGSSAVSAVSAITPATGGEVANASKKKKNKKKNKKNKNKQEQTAMETEADVTEAGEAGEDSGSEEESVDTDKIMEQAVTGSHC